MNLASSFRAKLVAVLGVTALGFLLIFGVSSFVSRRVDRQLAFIQTHYMPRLVLGPKLQADLERLERGFQDAVAAHDLEALEGTRDQKAEFLRSLDAAGDSVDAAASDALRRSLDDYWTLAYDVSRRLIAGETGEGLPAAIAMMQSRQAAVAALVDRTASLDRGELAAAFAATAAAESEAKNYRLWVSVVSFGSVLLVVLGLIRGLVRSLSALTTGFASLGRGEFGERIAVVGDDELAQLARDANTMAESLETLDAERGRIELALKSTNRELEAFSYSVAHDLRAPLRGINGYSTALLEDYGADLPAEAKEYLGRITAATHRMADLIDALLSLSRVTRAEFHREPVDLGLVAESVASQLRTANPDRQVELVREGDVVAQGDARLLRALLENLLGNAWKFTARNAGARITVGVATDGPTPVYFVRDNGAGFDMAYADKLFAPFQRLHAQSEFAGTGIGLATVHRIVSRHGGRIWAEGAVGKGATFRFTLGGDQEGTGP
ncbi:MAG TPA: ATP-binding protein [Polyangiaceae bacterium]|jgi:signal transduction histidine kinase